MSEEKGIHCPIKDSLCWEESCMFWVQWQNGGECAIHAIAVQMAYLKDEGDSKEGEEEK